MRFGGAAQLIDRDPYHVVLNESAGGLWQIQMNLTVTGAMRLHVVHRSLRLERLTDYWLGTEELHQVLTMGLVKRILEGLPEEFEPRVLARLLPGHSVVTDHGEKRLARPIGRDPDLVRKLGFLAGLDGEGVWALVDVMCAGGDGLGLVAGLVRVFGRVDE